MTRRDDEDRDCEVGYGRPPAASRFKKGKSGNPKGRPKAAKGFSASLRRELEMQVTVREGKREFRISKAEAAAKRLVALAVGGDLRALTKLAQLDQLSDERMASPETEMGGAGTTDPVDLAILRHHFANEDLAADEPVDDRARSKEGEDDGA